MVKIGKFEVRPIQDYMLLKLVEEQQPSGLVIPKSVDRTKDDSAMFEVIDAGPGYWESGVYIPSDIVAGYTVMVSAYGLGKISIDNQMFIVARARDVAMILKREGVKI